MSKSSLLDRLAQPRSLAAIFAAIMAFIAVTAIPAEARRHGHRSYHAFHHHFSHHRVYARHERSHRFSASTSGGGGEIIGEHRGFAAIVVDGNSGETLYARNEHELRHPASVTKVMTLYLLFEQLEKGRLRLDTPLMISAHAAAQAPPNSACSRARRSASRTPSRRSSPSPQTTSPAPSPRILAATSAASRR
jgi:D-alanyl-D-alanine carboxypeptidase